MSEQLDVEWMFADAGKGALGIEALAPYNPFRWSGSLDFMTGVRQMQELIENSEGDRPIVVKIPSGITSREHLCKDVATAIEHMKLKSPEHIKVALERMEAQEKKKLLLKLVEERITELQSAETTLQQEEDKAREAKTLLHDLVTELGEQKGKQYQWMFDDAGSGWGMIGLGGIGGKLAHLNPARWSQKNCLSTAQEMLDVVAHEEKHCDRPVLLKILEEGQDPQEITYQKAEFAVAYLRGVIEELHPELKPLEDAHADAEDRVAAAKIHVKKAKKTLEDCQAEAKAASALN